MDANDDLLSEALLDRILEKLDLPAEPPPDLDGLAEVYGAWCTKVPFDNLRKLIHLGSGNPGPLAGDDVVEFFEAWLAWGTGGTCWAGNGALCMLLKTLGFDAVRGVATMMVVPDLPPNHGTVVVTLGGRRYLVDASMLFAKPLLLVEDEETTIEHPSRGVRCAKRDGKWTVRWRPLHMPNGLDCRIDSLSATAAEFHEFHEATRGWSPFNYAANARINRGDDVVGLAFRQRTRIAADGTLSMTPIDHRERQRILVEEVGIHPQLVEKIPEDRDTPPPPWSSTAGG
jgi:N-hydroxyarylamine O-acetyltransferase